MERFLVVGAGSSIGKAVVLNLKALGYEVITTARNPKDFTPDYPLDASDFEATEKVFAAVGELAGVVNCAGSLLLKPAHLTSFEEYQAVISASLTTSFSVVRAAGKYMRAGGSVVLISSAAAQIGLVNHEAIAAAKAGIIGLIRSASATYAPQHLRFNAVAPGLVETQMTAMLTQNDMMRQASIGMHPLGRLGKPEDISQAVVFFLKPENSWVTGQVLAVDGGLSGIKPRAKL